MKKQLCLGLSLVCLLSVLTACGKQEAAAPCTGADYNSYITTRGSLAYTPEACFIFEDNQLTFYDAALTSGRTVLCSRADCDHTTDDCTSFVNAFSVYAWETHLYYVTIDPVTFDLELWQMDLDGTNRTKLRTLPVNPGSSFTWEYDITAGHLLLRLDTQTADGDTSVVHLFSLTEPNTAPVTLFASSAQEETAAASAPWLFEDWIFYDVWSGGHFELYGYRVSTGETELICSDWAITDSLTLVENTLYMHDFSDGALRSMDLESREITEYRNDLPTQQYPWGSFDDQYFYQYALNTDSVSMEAQELIIYDLTGQEIQRLSLSGAGLDVPVCYAMSTPDYVLFRPSPTYSYSSSPICYLEKEALAEGRAKLIPLEEKP